MLARPSTSGAGASILGGALAIGIVNPLFRPILFLLTPPLTIVTFGLFALVMNALLLWFATR